MNNLTRERAQEILRPAKGKRVLVLGDYMIDRYVEGVVTRISPEAPVPVVLHERTTEVPGGAGNVAANVNSLGVLVDLIKTKWLQIPIKQRIIASGQQLLRIDLESSLEFVEAETAYILNRVYLWLPRSNAVIISDYNKGCVTQEVLSAVAALCLTHDKPLCIGPKPRPAINHLLNGHWVCLNKQEAELLDAKHVSRSIVFRTEGSEGIVLCEAGVETPVRGHNVTALDVCGAGDTVLAAVTVARLGGATPLEAAQLANAAAAVVVQKKGTATVTTDELLKML